uniref:BZIP domain-containing protein n=1 Tax=Leersia perrieri TaxID=77586 RepID=A0A0D9WU83_9ORYZ
MENYHQFQMAAAWPREPDSPQLSIMSGCSSLFSISTLRDDDGGGGGGGGHAIPATPVSLAVIATGDEVEMEVRQQSGGSGDDRRTIRMMRNRESALRSRARKRAYVEELEKEVRRLVDDNLNLKKQCKEY